MSSRFNFFLTEALRSLSTNLATSVAATLAMLVALLVVGVCSIFLIIGYQEANKVSKQAGRVQVFLKATATDAEVNALRGRFENMPETQPGTVQFISKDDALRRAKRLFKESPGLVEDLPSNPFPASVEAKLRDPRKAEAVARRFEGEAGVDEVKYPAERDKKIVRGATVASTVLTAIGLFLVIAATMLVANTIRLSIFARRREIEVMKLVGASNSFVRLPFMIEGFVCGLVAALGAIILMLGGKKLLDSALDTSLLSAGDGVPIGMIYLALLAGGLVLGGFGSGLTIRKYLKI